MSIPVSKIATLTALPLATAQASSALIRATPQGIGWLSLTGVGVAVGVTVGVGVDVGIGVTVGVGVDVGIGVGSAVGVGVGWEHQGSQG